jgi:O-antigen ligase
MVASNGLQDWVARLDRRLYALLIGVAIGVMGGVIGLLLAVAGPIITFGLILGVLAGLYILTSLNAALYGVIFVMALLPFGTFPFKIGFTPTLLDAAMGAFLLVYVLQFMTGRRRGIQLTPVHALIALYMGWLILSFIFGIRHARPTSANLRQFAETLLSISMAFVLVDILRDGKSLRRLLIVIAVAATAQAIITLGLYLLNDQAAERTLIRLARIGYPAGGVIRYIEDNPALSERAIGTWVDPNALGGFLALCAALIAPQLFARRPILRPVWIMWGIVGLLGICLLLTYSRASMLAFAVALAFIGLFKGYRRFLIVLLIGAIAVLILPQTRDYVIRFSEAFTGGDLATQMRIGEYGDSLELISRYPLTGVGFTGTPSIDLYTDVASMYLIMANQIGLVGVCLFAITIAGVFVYGLRSLKQAYQVVGLRSLHLGALAALLAALVNATADLYFFRLDFQASITLFWLIVALALASSRVIRQEAAQIELTVETR